MPKSSSWTLLFEGYLQWNYSGHISWWKTTYCPSVPQTRTRMPPSPLHSVFLGLLANASRQNRKTVQTEKAVVKLFSLRDGHRTVQSSREFGKVTEHRSIRRSQLHSYGLAKLKSEKLILFTMASKEQKPVSHSFQDGTPRQQWDPTPPDLTVLMEVTRGMKETHPLWTRPQSSHSAALRNFL